MDSQGIDVDKVRKLYDKNSTARLFFDNMASRQRNQNETKVDRILAILKSEGNEVPRGEIINLFKQLQDAGCGQFVPGRHSWPSRFVWSVESLGAAKVATGEVQEAQSIADGEGLGNESQDMIKHVFNLRSDLEVSFELPLDLTEKESERLATFLRSLPMEEYL